MLPLKDCVLQTPFEKADFVLFWNMLMVTKFMFQQNKATAFSAYLGGEQFQNQSLNKLGGLEFAKRKERAKKAIEELAVN